MSGPQWRREVNDRREPGEYGSHGSHEINTLADSVRVVTDMLNIFRNLTPRVLFQLAMTGVGVEKVSTNWLISMRSVWQCEVFGSIV